MSPTPTRMATPVGYEVHASAMWDGACGPLKLHSARVILGRTGDQAAATELMKASDWQSVDWSDKACDRCGAPVPPDDEASNGAGTRTIWDTPSGDLEPGCMFWNDWYPHNDKCWPAGWTNCDGKHLMAVTPDGHHWDIDGRASNCTMPDDTTHRCWVRSGEPPNVTAGKAGHTCQAGAGSIATPGYHGFLRDGAFS